MKPGQVKTSMRQMIAKKLDPVEEFRRAIRHAAHVYVNTPTPEGPDAAGRRLEAQDANAKDLYRAARAMVAAELLQMNTGKTK
jgi:hypothetical protein